MKLSRPGIQADPSWPCESFVSFDMQTNLKNKSASNVNDFNKHNRKSMERAFGLKHRALSCIDDIH